MITSPTQISNCVVWLDATDTTTLSSLSGGAGNSLINTSLTGDFVGGWGDKSGNNRHFTNIGGSASTRPTWIAALSTVRFDGSNDYLSSFFNITYTAQTVFVVVSNRSSTLGGVRVYSQCVTGGDDAFVSNHYIPCLASSGSFYSYREGNTRSTVSTRGNFLFGIYASWISSTSTNNFYNGSGGTPYTLGTSYNFAVNISRLGATTATPGAYTNSNFSGDISEVIVYNKALSNAEREDVEYYLTRKWSFLNVIPRQVYAIRSGNWSNSTTWSTSADPLPWTFPLSSDNVYSNTFAVTADQNAYVNTLQTNALSPNIAAGGTFAITQPNITLTAPSGFLAGTTTCITGLLSSGTSILSGNFGGLGVSHIGNGELRMVGNVTGGSVASSVGATNNGNGLLGIFGNVLGGTNATAYGTLNNSSGNLTVVGNISGSSATTGLVNNSFGACYVYGDVRPGAGISVSAGISNASTGNVYVYGNVFGGTITNNNSAIGNSSSGAILVVGNVTGGSGGNQAINNVSTGTLLISGTITASPNAHGVISPNAGARNEFTGSLVNDISGRQAVYAARYLLRPQMFNSFTRIAGPSATNTPVFYYAPESYSTTFVPHTSSVAVGTAYAAVSSLSGVAVNIPVQLSGTMVVPSVGSVDRGKLVGPSGVGTAIITTESLQKVWDINTATLTATNSIGSRLSNTATIDQVGQQILTLNI